MRVGEAVSWSRAGLPDVGGGPVGDGQPVGTPLEDVVAGGDHPATVGAAPDHPHEGGVLVALDGEVGRGDLGEAAVGATLVDGHPQLVDGFEVVALIGVEDDGEGVHLRRDVAEHGQDGLVLLATATAGLGVAGVDQGVLPERVRRVLVADGDGPDVGVEADDGQVEVDLDRALELGHAALGGLGHPGHGEGDGVGRLAGTVDEVGAILAEGDHMSLSRCEVTRVVTRLLDIITNSHKSQCFGGPLWGYWN